ncbi:IS30 family transposase [Cobetia sp. cqz5-12]|nr:helix-turn-helix domain-containing protein [Cobetia sp. cqz5-12]QQK63797.1 IS30 family transposase [Cobetia sp. cqz5-12]
MENRQLTQTQRYQIHFRYDLDISQHQIGKELNLHSSTNSREIRRNTTTDVYDPKQAQTLNVYRHRTTTKWTKRLPGIMAAVAGRLREEWSPQQISDFMAPLVGVSVSHQWIYSLIWDDKARGGGLWRHLRQPKRRNKHRMYAKSAGVGKMPNRVGIDYIYIVKAYSLYHHFIFYIILLSL